MAASSVVVSPSHMVVEVVPMTTGMVHARTDITVVGIVPVMVVVAGAQTQQPDEDRTDSDDFFLVHGA